MRVMFRIGIAMHLVMFGIWNIYARYNKCDIFLARDNFYSHYFPFLPGAMILLGCCSSAKEVAFSVVSCWSNSCRGNWFPPMVMYLAK